MWWWNVQSSYFSFADEEMIAVGPVMSSSRGLTFLLVYNYQANLVLDHQGFTSGLWDCTPTPLEGSYGGTFRRGTIAPYSRLNLCYTYTEKLIHCFTAGIHVRLLSDPCPQSNIRHILMNKYDSLNPRGGYLGSYGLQTPNWTHNPLRLYHRSSKSHHQRL